MNFKRYYGWELIKLISINVLTLNLLYNIINISNELGVGFNEKEL